jgi:hypothetical protein
LPLFGVMAAVAVRGEVVAAAIDGRRRHRAGNSWRGRLDRSADGRRSELRVATPVPPEQMTGNVSWRYLPEPLRGTVCANLRLGGSWDYRCAAHEYRTASAGHCHLLFFNLRRRYPGFLLTRHTDDLFLGEPVRFIRPSRSRTLLMRGGVSGTQVRRPPPAYSSCWRYRVAGLPR